MQMKCGLNQLQREKAAQRSRLLLLPEKVLHQLLRPLSLLHPFFKVTVRTLQDPEAEMVFAYWMIV
jgi:hypothetical protein